VNTALQEQEEQRQCPVLGVLSGSKLAARMGKSCLIAEAAVLRSAKIETRLSCKAALKWLQTAISID